MVKFHSILWIILISKAITVTSLNAEELINYTDRLSRPDLSLLNTENQKTSLSDFRGKVVLVNFWASWCGPCITEIPSLRDLYNKMADKPFEILAVNIKEGKFKVHKFTRLVEMPFPVLLDQNGKIFEDWNAMVLPTSYLLDAEGTIRYWVQGPVEWTSVEVLDVINKLMPEAISR